MLIGNRGSINLRRLDARSTSGLPLAVRRRMVSVAWRKV